MRRLVDKKKKRRGGRPLPEREHFPDALVLLDLWSRASGELASELERWRPDLERVLVNYQENVRKGRQPVGDAPASRDGGGARFTQRRRVRRRVADGD